MPITIQVRKAVTLLQRNCQISFSLPLGRDGLEVLFLEQYTQLHNCLCVFSIIANRNRV